MITMTLELLHSAGVFGYGQCGDTLDSDFCSPFTTPSLLTVKWSFYNILHMF